MCSSSMRWRASAFMHFLVDGRAGALAWDLVCCDRHLTTKLSISLGMF